MKTKAELKQDLLAQLKFERGQAVDGVRIAVTDGAVTLQGSVPSYAEKVAAVKAVQRVGGVKAVTDEIIVRLPDHQKCTDAEIETAAYNAIGWITTVPTESLEIIVRSGQLTLKGTVENCSQKSVVEDVVRHLAGVTGVVNMIGIKPQPLEPDVRAAIESAFERHALLDADRITVEVIGTKVILRGTTSSFAEKDEAEHAAWLAKGVTDVENRIVITV